MLLLDLQPPGEPFCHLRWLRRFQLLGVLGLWGLIFALLMCNQRKPAFNGAGCGGRIQSFLVLLSRVHPAAGQGAFHERFVFSSRSFSIGGQSSGWCSQGCQGIVDTGTSLLTVPTQVFTQLMQYIGAQADSNGQVRAGWATGGLDKLGASGTSRQLGWRGIRNPVLPLILVEEMMDLIKSAFLGLGVAARAGSLSPMSQQMHGAPRLQTSRGFLSP